MKSNKIIDKSKLQKLASLTEEERESNGKLTLEQLRNCEGFTNESDTEGLEVIENLYQLSQL
nr:hypothetical protein [Flavobacterium sp. ASV13]